MKLLAFALLPLVYSAAVPALAPRNNDNHWVSLLAVGPAVHSILPVFDVLPISPSGVFNGSDAILVNTTVRETFRVARGADQLRIRITNRFGTDTLNITGMSVAIPSPDQAGSSAIDATTLQTVTFRNGNQSVVIPPGADWVSDPVNLTVVHGCEVSISTYLANGWAGLATYHQTALNDVYYVKGDETQAGELQGPTLANDTSSWFVYSIEGWVSKETSAIVCIGDSITDGYESGINQNRRYPDQLSDRINKNPSAGQYSVVNTGISSNRLLSPGGWGGPAVLARIDQDVIAIPGATIAILLIGINDMAFASVGGTPLTVQDLIAGYMQFINRVHTAGIAAIGATVTPLEPPASFNGTSVYTPAVDELRNQVNDWIRTSGHFDYVVDFDKAVRNATYPSQMQLQYASPDYLHPNGLGYGAMADAFDLSVFNKLKGNVNKYV